MVLHCLRGKTAGLPYRTRGHDRSFPQVQPMARERLVIELQLDVAPIRMHVAC